MTLRQTSGGQLRTPVPFAVVAPRRGTVWVAPRRRRLMIGELTDAECRSLGAGLRHVARAMDAAWDDPDFNLVAHSAALGATERFQAYFEVAPHRREDASLGTLQYDVPISHLSPEQCAAEAPPPHAIAEKLIKQ